MNLKGNIEEMEMVQENRRISEENYELKSRLAQVESKIKREKDVDVYNVEYKDQDINYMKETIDRQEGQIIKLHEQYQKKIYEKEKKVESLNAKVKDQNK